MAPGPSRAPGPPTAPGAPGSQRTRITVEASRQKERKGYFTARAARNESPTPQPGPAPKKLKKDSPQWFGCPFRQTCEVKFVHKFHLDLHLFECHRVGLRPSEGLRPREEERRVVEAAEAGVEDVTGEERDEQAGRVEKEDK